jgi:hypothetical protein
MNTNGQRKIGVANWEKDDTNDSKPNNQNIYFTFGFHPYCVMMNPSFSLIKNISS